METNEETKKEETQESEAKTSTSESALSQNTENRGADTTLLEDAKATASRIEKANKELRDLLNKQEKMVAEQILEGRGLVIKSKGEKEMSAEEYWEAIREGKIQLK